MQMFSVFHSVISIACFAMTASTVALVCVVAGGIYLHGYTVRDQTVGSRRSAFELRPPSEEFKVFYLCAENANENKR